MYVLYNVFESFFSTVFFCKIDKMVKSLFERIGGEAAIEAAVELFYEKLVADENLKKFFEGVNMDNLKAHQRKFLQLAFTKIPEDVQVDKLMLEKHDRLFKMGLDETHFDMVAGHLVATLQALQVKSDLIDEAVAIVGPLRPIFQQGAEMAKSA